MTSMAPPNAELAHARGRLPLVLAGVAAVASLAAAVGGGTVPRLLLAFSLPVALGMWMQSVRRARPALAVVAVLVMLAVVGAIHVGLTSPAAAWTVDSHMAPELEVLLPPGSVRLALAWSVPLLWVASFVAMAVEARRRLGASFASWLLLVAGFAPMAAETSFPTDAYRLLRDSTVFGHAFYAVGACAILVFMIWPRSRAGEHSEMG